MLPPIYKEIIELRYLVGFTDKEICQHFGKPTQYSTYRVRALSALKKLKEIITTKEF